MSLHPVRMTRHIASCNVMPAMSDSFVAVFTALANALLSWPACWAIEKKFFLRRSTGYLDATVKLETQFSVETV